MRVSQNFLLFVLAQVYDFSFSFPPFLLIDFLWGSILDLLLFLMSTLCLLAFVYSFGLTVMYISMTLKSFIFSTNFFHGL